MLRLSQARTTPAATGVSFLLVAASLVMAPLSSKAAGALWLLLCLLGVWSGAVAAPAHPPRLRFAAARWLLACTFALACAAGATGYWHDAWDELHAPIRLLLSAMAGVALAGSWGGSSASGGRRPDDGLAHALVAACFAALALACVQGGNRLFPTNAIAWAVSIGFLVCLLLPMAFDPLATRTQQLVRGAGVLAGIPAVLLSQSRGAYGVVLWVMGYFAWQAWRHRRSRVARAGLGFGALALVATVVLALSASGRIVGKLEAASREWQLASSELASRDAADSSVGARVYMWRIAARGFADAPLLGVGSNELKNRIRQAGEQMHSDALGGLGHVHNEYLQAAYAHGIPGLASVLAILLGLVAAAVRVGRLDPRAGWQLAGLAFMHASAGATNVNTAHNYYGAMLGTCVLLAFMTARQSGARTVAG